MGSTKARLVLDALQLWAERDKPRRSRSGRTARCREAGPLTVGHFLSHVEQEASITFIDSTQEPAEHGQETRFLAGRAPGDFIRRLTFGQIGQIGRLFTVVKQLIYRYFEGPGHFLERFDGGNGVAIFDAGDVAAKQTCTLFDITLRKIFFLAQGAKTIANNHFCIISYGYDQRKPNLQTGDGESL
jgi:hypothetical protein